MCEIEQLSDVRKSESKHELVGKLSNPSIYKIRLYELDLICL